jgi:signal transduction histidine kinase
MEHNSEQGTLIHALQMNILRISLMMEGGIILFSLFFSTAFSKRLRQILASVRNMGEGDYSQHIQLRGTDELSILGREFNDLADRLQASEQTRRQFVSDASHELKTALATIKLLSDSILQNEMDPETEREFIDDIGREADRLGRLTQKLLALTKLDSTIAEDMEILEGGNTVRKVVRMLRPLAELRRITMDCSCDEGCSLMMVEDDLYQIVFNLAENAIKYNRDGGWVGLELRKKETTVELVVSDAGVGIPEQSLPHMFDRFYRVDKARSRAAGGSGLGLSIVHAMVQRNDGSIEVAVRPEGGTVFTVQFPLFDMKEEE